MEIYILFSQMSVLECGKTLTHGTIISASWISAKGTR